MQVVLICRSRKVGPFRLPAKAFYPLLVCRREFRRLGIEIKSQFSLKPRLMVDLAIVDSKLFYKSSPEETVEYLKQIRTQAKKIIWYDNRDSSGNPQFWVLPFVDRYYKSQMYRDLNAYEKQFRCNRMHTDYFCEQFGIAPSHQAHEPLSKYQEHIYKLEIGWNLGFGDFVYTTAYAELLDMLVLGRIRLPQFFDPCRKKTIDVHTRFKVGNEPTYSLHRSLALKGIEELRCVKSGAGRIPKSQFSKELANTKIVVSPFGWGEVCYRDFEAAFHGCCLVKPTMSHLRTWPDIFIEGQTYAPVDWDLTNLRVSIEQVLEDDEKRIAMVKKAQGVLRQVHCKNGLRDFVNRMNAEWRSL